MKVSMWMSEELEIFYEDEIELYDEDDETAIELKKEYSFLKDFEKHPKEVTTLEEFGELLNSFPSDGVTKTILYSPKSKRFNIYADLC